MSYKPIFTEFSLQDYNSLDGSQKKQVRKSFQKIKQDGMSTGKILHGNLSDCRRLKHKRLGLRVVFKQSDNGIEIIEIVAVGKREDDEVYDTAARRLGRI
jgi:mRNA interferase RelE/StbE